MNTLHPKRFSKLLQVRGLVKAWALAAQMCAKLSESVSGLYTDPLGQQGLSRVGEEASRWGWAKRVSPKELGGWGQMGREGSPRSLTAIIFRWWVYG